GERPAVADEQLPLTGDVARGDPRTTALRYESDFVPWKPRADALCVGNAYPGDAKRATHCVAAFGVGGWLKAGSLDGHPHREARDRAPRQHADRSRAIHRHADLV